MSPNAAPRVESLYSRDLVEACGGLAKIRAQSSPYHRQFGGDDAAANRMDAEFLKLLSGQRLHPLSTLCSICKQSVRRHAFGRAQALYEALASIFITC